MHARIRIHLPNPRMRANPPSCVNLVPRLLNGWDERGRAPQVERLSVVCYSAMNPDTDYKRDELGMVIVPKFTNREDTRAYLDWNRKAERAYEEVMKNGWESTVEELELEGHGRRMVPPKSHLRSTTSPMILTLRLSMPTPAAFLISLKTLSSRRKNQQGALSSRHMKKQGSFVPRLISQMILLYQHWQLLRISSWNYWYKDMLWRNQLLY